MIVIIFGVIIGAIVCRLVLKRFRNKEWYIYLWLPITMVSSLWLFSLIPIVGKEYVSGMAGGMDIMIDTFRIYIGAPMIAIFMGCLISPPIIRALSFKTLGKAMVVNCLILLLSNLAMKSRKVNFEIIDQFGKPVTAAEFNLHTRNESMIGLVVPINEGRLKANSDSDGACVVRYYFFQKLYIDNIEKDGYEFKWHRWNEKLFRNKIKKININAWKRGGAVPLQKNKIKINLTTDNQEYFVNLTTGTIQNGYDALFVADLIIRMQSFGRRDWTVSMEAIEGGLIIAEDDFLYWAPESGYKRKVELKREHDGRTRRLYLRSRNGSVYSALKVSVYGYPNQKGRIRIDCISNTNGQKNLEWDPSVYR